MLKTKIFAIILMAMLVQGCNSSNKEKQHTDTNKIVKDDVVAKKFVLTTLDNKSLHVEKTKDGFVIDEYKNKVIIFDIFATWCPPCQAEAQTLSNIQKKYKKDVVVIGVSVEDGIDNSKLRMFSKEYNAKYIFVNSNQNSKLIKSILKSLDVNGRSPIPFMVLYKNGKYIKHFIGATYEEFITTEIDKALEKK